MYHEKKKKGAFSNMSILKFVCLFASTQIKSIIKMIKKILIFVDIIENLFFNMNLYTSSSQSSDYTCRIKILVYTVLKNRISTNRQNKNTPDIYSVIALFLN
jgi:hypothetical protein